MLRRGITFEKFKKLSCDFRPALRGGAGAVCIEILPLKSKAVASGRQSIGPQVRTCSRYRSMPCSLALALGLDMLQILLQLCNGHPDVRQLMVNAFEPKSLE